MMHSLIIHPSVPKLYHSYLFPSPIVLHVSDHSSTASGGSVETHPPPPTNVAVSHQPSSTSLSAFIPKSRTPTAGKRMWMREELH
ncbi:hypothetical protein JHK82_015216 [Glycine max]|uniref:Uncharacterized protein n=1 Tax=Glycine max TaxID=3847 RepID=K7KUW9_SOYBN|nr:hypothetical protein JHK85_015596 [Glycine max]KAG5045832.1 hypothetical protein JHK86_015238 [Glycine max]KAG5148335.1 hypothetical protein JHK82_015216 [Glycine max]KAH1125755.1 hypothetical protein GYH30_015027 [Glycine max]KRH53642.1 hypothetical protein GLYMA_06G137500v4 [Glycine max]